MYMPCLSIKYLILKKDANQNEQCFQQVTAAILKTNILKSKHIPTHTITQNISKTSIDIKKEKDNIKL